MPRTAALVVLLVAAATLGACASNQRYGVSRAPAATTYPPPTPAVSYTPAPTGLTGQPSIGFDLSRTDRQSAQAEAMRYCSAQGMNAAFRSIDGYRLTYDCFSPAASAMTPAGGMMAAVPSITYQNLGGDPLALQADAGRFCQRQGLVAAYRGTSATRVVYDCVPGGTAAVRAPAAMSGSSMPAAIPTITYEMPGDLRQAPEAAALRYCGQLGLTPSLVDRVGKRLTYECR